MTGISRFLLRIARWIAGSERAEWIDAMEAEAESIAGESTAWAIGCVRAALKDRILREWRFLAAILLLPICIYLVQFALFFPIVWLGRQAGLPNWTFVAFDLFLPFPFAFLLGRIRPGLPAYFALPISFAIAVFFPLIVFSIQFGTSPLAFFGPGGTFYMMTPWVGLSCSLFVWLAGVWLGSRSGRAAPTRG